MMKTNTETKAEENKLDQIQYSELTIDGMPKKYQMRNFLLLVMGSSIFNFGWAMMGTINTPYFNWLNLKESTIGFIGSLSFLALFGQILSPWISRHFVRKKFLSVFCGLPYLWSALAVGIGIFLAMHANDYSWLTTYSIICFIAWPFFGGWGAIPAQEYQANCISKERIGTFVGTSQILGPLLGLAGSLTMNGLMVWVGVPTRYALAFLLAYLLAQLGALGSLFAKETPAPAPPREPFWHPMRDAFTNDKVFRKLLLVAFLAFGALMFTYNFIPLLAIREWGMPDWVAGVYYTVLMGAQTVGGLIATWLGRKRFGYSNVIKIAFIVFLVSFIPLIIPQTRMAKEDVYHGQWVLSKDIQMSYEQREQNRESDLPFQILGQYPCVNAKGQLYEIELEFNRAVDATTFNVYDVKVVGPDDKRLNIDKITASIGTSRNFKLLLTEPLSMPGNYKIEVYPYIFDTKGNALDQNGDGRTGKDQWRFFIGAVMYGVAFMMINACIMSLMFILAPDNRRAGYFSAMNITLMITPGIFSLLAGFCFRPGSYQLVFGLTAVIFIPVMIFCFRLLKQVTATELEKRGLNHS